jgi:hypothetical protein
MTGFNIKCRTRKKLGGERDALHWIAAGSSNDIQAQEADGNYTGSRDPDHVFAQHAGIPTSDQNAAGIRAA